MLRACRSPIRKPLRRTATTVTKLTASLQQARRYRFKGDEKSKLRASYHDINRVDRSHRVTVVREQVMPVRFYPDRTGPVDVVATCRPHLRVMFSVSSTATASSMTGTPSS